MSALTKEQIAALPGLLAEATPGPWKVCETSIHGKKYGGCWVEGPDEEDYNGNLHGALIPVSGSHGSKSYTTRLVDRQDHDHNDANARLIALAPSLAAIVIEQQAEIERLTAIIAVMDASSPRADHTCAEPGITLSQAVEREYPHLARAVLEVKP